MTRGSLLVSLRALINYHRSCGVSGYAGDQRGAGVLQDLQRSALEAVADDAEATPPPPINDEAAGQTRPAADALAELAGEIAVCRQCRLHEERVVATPGRGEAQSRLLLVGEWLSCTAKGTVPEDRLFGSEEDRMVGRMVAAIGLSRSDVFITNIIKCAIAGTEQPTIAEATVCGRYLQRQIELLDPHVICGMGPIAGQVLSGSDRPLSLLRGRSLSCAIAAGREIPLVMTYHPSFLLQNPEMKKAAWADLQRIQKHLLDRHRSVTGR